MAAGDADRVYRVGRIALLAGSLKHHSSELVETLRVMTSGFSSGRPPATSDGPDRTANAGLARDEARDDLARYDELTAQITAKLERVEAIREAAQRGKRRYDGLLREIAAHLEAADGLWQKWMSCPWCGHPWEEHKRITGRPSKCQHVDEVPSDEEGAPPKGVECKCKPVAFPGGLQGCEVHEKHKNPDGTPIWRAVSHPKTTVKGNLPRRARLCEFCYRHVLHFGHVPTAAEIELERQGKLEGCLIEAAKPKAS